ncbi:substance-K receptor-like [Stylophora pistillata]|uniref:substance-K receptor-like n=1 Tax=Stylophora pistillata TaxID=50429 RepID=UPI000C051A0E|nr:substance-K receptor-like [Stylophora pistillata]
MPGSNNTSRNFTEATISTHDVVFASLYSFIVLFGVIGNSIVITIILKTQSNHTTTNYLLMNLALADLLTLLFCPGLYDFALQNVYLNGFSGDLICKLFAGNAIVPITINVAVLTVCTIAVERYLALLKPFHSNLRIKEDRVKYFIAGLWLLGLLSCIPDIQANTYNVTSTYSKYPCKRPWSLDEYFLHKPFIIFTCAGFGVVSFVILLFCYFEIIRGLYFTKTIFSESSVTGSREKQEKKRLAKLLIWLTIIFALCSLPFAVFFIFLISSKQAFVQDNYNTLHLLHRLCRFCLFSNSFFNPFLYALQSSNFRDGFKRIFQSCMLFRALRRTSQKSYCVELGGLAKL